MTTKTKKLEKSKTDTSENLQDTTLISPEETKEIKVIERIIESREVAPADVFGKLQRSQIELMKRTIAKGASDDELKMFLQVCKGSNLNPFLKQVFLVPRWDSKVGAEIRAIQVSIDGFRAIAEESGAYAGNTDPSYEGEDEITYTIGKDKEKKTVTNKIPNSATVTVYKIVQGLKCEFTATARWAEYYPGDKQGFMWKTKPYIMLGKCAEALALRKAFPKLLSGMYAAEELDKGQTDTTGAQTAQNGLNTLMTMIDKAGIDQLLELKSKVEKTTKYDAKGKAELIKAIESKLNEIDSKME